MAVVRLNSWKAFDVFTNSVCFCHCRLVVKRMLSTLIYCYVVALILLDCVSHQFFTDTKGI